MAYTSWQSGAVPGGTQYYTSKQPLGDYMLYLQFDATSGTPTVVARCDYPSGIRGATQKSFPEGTQIQQWSIEANETEVSVYATLADKAEAHGSIVDTSEVDTSALINPNYVYKIYAYTFEEVVVNGFWHYTLISGSCLIARLPTSGTAHSLWLFCSKSPFTFLVHDSVYGNPDQTVSASTISNNGISYYVYHIRAAGLNPYYNDMVESRASYNGQNVYPNEFDVAHLLLNGSIEYEDPEISNQLIARFAINLGYAGGYPGGGGGWTQPGDWNSDPTTTLHLTVNGALSGRHNDPLNDTSFSYVPSDKATVKDYGCGGDGGNGGGGGAGASTIIVRQFATNKANSKDILALAKRHGYGSGGGKGGKGGDGCILIYY